MAAVGKDNTSKTTESLDNVIVQYISELFVHLVRVQNFGGLVFTLWLPEQVTKDTCNSNTPIV